MDTPWQLKNRNENGRSGRLVMPCFRHRRGYMLFEMIVTIAIITVLVASIGIFFVKLLHIREREREEAYVREKLADVCGEYADKLSIGSSIITTSTNATVVKYRMETGGVSLETGLVTRVAYLSSLVNPANDTIDMNIYSVGKSELNRKISRSASGDAKLMPLLGDMVSCTLTPLWTAASSLNAEELTDMDTRMCMEMVPSAVFQTTGAALGYLQVKSRYEFEDDDGNIAARTVTVGRVVRLWNRK